MSLIRSVCFSKISPRCLAPFSSSSFFRRYLTNDSRTRLLVSGHKFKAKEQHIFSVPLDVKEGTLGSPTHLFTLRTTPAIYNAAQYVNGMFCFLPRPHGYEHDLTEKSYSPIHLFKAGNRFLVPPDEPPEHINEHEQIISISHNLGYDPKQDEYKVLSLRRMVDKINYSHSSICKIFTVGTNSWRVIQPVMPFDILRRPTRGDFVNGKMYWVHESWGRKDHLVAFDFADEQFSSIQLYPLDQFLVPFRDEINVVEINGGRVALAGYSSSNNRSYSWRTMELRILEDAQNQVWKEKKVIYPYGWGTPEELTPVGTVNTTGEILFATRNYWSNGSPAFCFYDMNGSPPGFRRNTQVTEIIPNWKSLGFDRVEITATYEEIEDLNGGFSNFQNQNQLGSDGEEEHGDDWSLDGGDGGMFSVF